MAKIIGIVGSGLVGRDPFDPRCWSRAGYHLFQALKKAGTLHRAFGVEVPHPARALLMLRNFHPRRDLWRQRFYLDPKYYELLTREIRHGLEPGDFAPGNSLLQIGGHYNSALAAGGRIPAFSYHDGNVAGMMKSPYFPKACLPRARRAFDYEKGVYRDLTRIFVMADYWRRSFVEDFGVSPERVVNVAYGANVEIPPVTPKDYSRKQILFVGIDFARKGGENLVRAFARLSSRHPQATLHVVGPPDVPAALRAPGLGNIEFHGLLSREVPEQKRRLLELYSRATLMVLPSLYEPFGNALLEGMLYRIPVIATNNWAFPDFVTPETGALLDDPADVAAMAERMDAFLSDPAASERAGDKGRELILARYTWDQVVRRMASEIDASTAR